MRAWRILGLAAVLALAADAAEAGPAFAAVLAAGGSFVAAFQATVVGAFLSSTFGRILVTVALTALQSAMAAKPRSPGITTEVTQAGGANPLSAILGTYATGGYAVAPQMSHGKDGKTPNAYLTTIIDVGDIATPTLDGLIIDGQYAPIGGTAHPDYGTPIGGRFAGYAWVRYRNGTGTSADPMLLAKYGAYPRRPWLADMIGRGVPHLIITTRYNREVFAGFPQFRPVSRGIRFYDPRKDSTVGGSGAHRWANPSTWEETTNPVVMIYGILRGFTLLDGSRWGGEAEAADLPLSSWFTAMNVCDQAVSLAGGGTEPRYRAGIEILFDEEPADYVEELLKACAGAIVETAGVWKLRAGGPGLPVYFFTDDDVIVSSPQDFDPFPGLDATYNGIHATYPEPASLWETRDAPPRYNAGWEAADKGRRLLADLGLPAVPYRRQVQRLMRANIRGERNFRRHGLTLPPAAAILEPLDVVSWTSAWNGYVTKGFDVSEVGDDQVSCNQRVALQETDPADHDWVPADELPSPDVVDGYVDPSPQSVPGAGAEGIILGDGTSGRRSAGRLFWDGSELDDVRAIEWQVRRTGTTTVVASGSTDTVEAGEQIVKSGIIPKLGYEGRLRAVVRRPRAWTTWIPFIAPEVFIAPADLTHQDVSGNLIPNGRFVQGDLRGWSDVPATHAVVARDPASPSSAIASARTPFILLVNPDPAALFARALTLTVAAGEQFAIEFDAAGGGPTILRTVTMQVAWHDGAGALVSASTLSRPLVSPAWGTSTATVTVPAGAVEARVLLGTAAGGTGSAYVTNVEMVKKRPAPSLMLQRSIGRAEIGPGAISDLYQAIDVGPRNGASSQATALTLDIGTVPRGANYQRGIVFEARNPGYNAAVSSTSMAVVLQARFAKLGGAFGPWLEMKRWEVTSTAWDVYEDATLIAGFYDDLEYRVIYLNNSSANNATPVLRQIYLTIVNVAAGLD